MIMRTKVITPHLCSLPRCAPPPLQSRNCFTGIAAFGERIVKAQVSASAPNLKRMRALLAGRFELVWHEARKEIVVEQAVMLRRLIYHQSCASTRELGVFLKEQQQPGGLLYSKTDRADKDALLAQAI